MLTFNASQPLTLGLELELQVVDMATGRLSSFAEEVHQLLEDSPRAKQFALEATLSTIELNSSVHTSAPELETEMRSMILEARTMAQQLGKDIRGGGTQVTQFWNERVTAHSPRAKELDGKFGFLPKRFSTYGMHVHMGMPNGDAAIRVANVLQGLAPLLIAVSAASPFLQMADTGFASSRPLESLVYPQGGPMPYLRDWAHLQQETDDLFQTGIAQSLKDLYWDVRPKPEFGTVEVRVFDTPLSLSKAVELAAFTRGLAALALNGDLVATPDWTTLTNNLKVSRFFACKDGLNAQLFDPFSQTWVRARDWVLTLLDEVLNKVDLPQDRPYLEAFKAHLHRMQDCDYMRAVWADLDADKLGQQPSNWLPDFHQAMAHQLLKAETSTP